MKKRRAVDVERLQNDVEWALAQGLGPRDLVPMLERLQRHAPRGSTAACFAGTELAELLLYRNPWRSALLAREVLAHAESDRGWAVLGLALALLGHYRSAKRAFAKALCLAPSCDSYAHNLGHLLDAGLGRPLEALPWLERAARGRPGDVEVAASYAHALVRVGRTEDARRVLARALASEPERVESLLERWSSGCAATP
jgi:tetratricopeptide (TPR) repeat protein